MCIRDSHYKLPTLIFLIIIYLVVVDFLPKVLAAYGLFVICLLYTSDAADERSSVDLGGRRIIKKKNNDRYRLRRTYIKHNRLIVHKQDL